MPTNHAKQSASLSNPLPSRPVATVNATAISFAFLGFLLTETTLSTLIPIAIGKFKHFFTLFDKSLFFPIRKSLSVLYHEKKVLVIKCQWTFLSDKMKLFKFIILVALATGATR